MLLSHLSLLATLLLASVQAADDAVLDQPLYKDPKASVGARVEDLLSRMAIEEKTSQLVQGDLRNWLNVTDGSLNATGLEWSMKYRGGSYYIYAEGPKSWKYVNDGVKIAQDYLVRNTTLGIPAWVQGESIHGFLIPNATIFNSPIGYACSWNPDLVEKMAVATAKEALALGVNNLFAPLADLARELRFGRVEETFGEDPFLTGEMAYHYVKGLQAGNVSAMVKHYAAFASPEQGLNTGPVHGGRRELLTTYLPPFKRAIIDGGAHSIMSAYSAYDGVPAVADKYMLTDILRDSWGYEYFVMSDAGATDRLCNEFAMCKNDPIDSEAVVNYALPAGNDIEMGGGSYSFEKIPQMLESGKLSSDVVDEAVRRTLRAKFAAGLFENPYLGVPDEEHAKHIHTDETVELARQIDAESIVLLENHENVLPLKKDAKIAVIGPMAHGLMNVLWRLHGSQIRQSWRNPFDGIRAASRSQVTYAEGCERWSSDRTGFASAVSAAQAADAAVVVVGTWSRDQNELWAGLNATTGEHVDAHDLNLMGAMPHLVQAVVDTGKPTVVVFSSGKPVTEPWISDRAAALVQQFYPSEQGAPRWPTCSSGTMSTSPDPGALYGNGTMKFGHAYVLQTPEPLYEFGYGLSYSTFRYGNLKLSQTTATAADTIAVSVDVTNESTRDGAEVVQLYVKDVISSVAVPNMQLRGFAKVPVKAGATVTVELQLKVQDLGLWDIGMKYVVEPGEFKNFHGNAMLCYAAAAPMFRMP
ncbi:uncharacterized protein PG986_011888 [Apiospora aurea]|uniref:Fibronectin type III-like domain-containing protein n=1 Tax=Apiospora aurea TaxID=335848 RepID=A0ABR1PYF6_9PEZI